MRAYAKHREAQKTALGLVTCVWGDSKLTLTCWIFYRNESENSATLPCPWAAIQRCMRSIVCVLVGDGVPYRNACVLYETNYICTLCSPTVIQDFSRFSRWGFCWLCRPHVSILSEQSSLRKAATCLKVQLQVTKYHVTVSEYNVKFCFLKLVGYSKSMMSQ